MALFWQSAVGAGLVVRPVSFTPRPLRDVSHRQSGQTTRHHVQVAFVAIGATMVGTITFLKNVGEQAQKGDQVGTGKTEPRSKLLYRAGRLPAKSCDGPESLLRTFSIVLHASDH